MAALAGYAQQRWLTVPHSSRQQRQWPSRRVLTAIRSQEQGGPDSNDAGQAQPPPPPAAAASQPPPLPPNPLSDPAGVVVYGGRLPPARRLVISGLSATAIGEQPVAPHSPSLHMPLCAGHTSHPLAPPTRFPMLQCWAATCLASPPGCCPWMAASWPEPPTWMCWCRWAAPAAAWTPRTVSPSCTPPAGLPTRRCTGGTPSASSARRRWIHPR